MTDALAGLAILAFVALAIDAMIPARKGSWKGGAASASDVARIVSGGKPSDTERTGAQMALLLVVVFVLVAVFYGG